MDYDAKRQAFAARDAFAQFLGIELTDMGPGHARAEMELCERLQNGAGVAHGGAVFTLADFAFAMQGLGSQLKTTFNKTSSTMATTN